MCHECYHILHISFDWSFFYGFCLMLILVAKLDLLQMCPLSVSCYFASILPFGFRENFLQDSELFPMVYMVCKCSDHSAVRPKSVYGFCCSYFWIVPIMKHFKLSISLKIVLFVSYFHLERCVIFCYYLQ